MLYELLRVSLEGTLAIVMLWAPGHDCDQQVIDHLPWRDTRYEYYTYQMENSCRITYRAKVEDIPQYYRGYDSWEIDLIMNANLKQGKPYSNTVLFFKEN